MIDITPLDVRKKRGDFGRRLRGYDPQEVDTFLELVAERLEEAVKEVVQLRERVTDLQRRVERSEGREQAVQEALVMAQELREEIRSHAHREAELIKREAEEEVERVRARTGALLEERAGALEKMDRWRSGLLRNLRTFLNRELEAVNEEESRNFSTEPGTYLSPPAGETFPAEAGDGTELRDGTETADGTEDEVEGEILDRTEAPEGPVAEEDGMLPQGPEANWTWEPRDPEREDDPR